MATDPKIEFKAELVGEDGKKKAVQFVNDPNWAERQRQKIMEVVKREKAQGSFDERLQAYFGRNFKAAFWKGYRLGFLHGIILSVIVLAGAAFSGMPW